MAPLSSFTGESGRAGLLLVPTWLACLLVFVASTAGAAAARSLDRPLTSALVYVLGVTAIGAMSGLRGGLVAALSASAIYNFFLSEPVLQFSAASVEDLVPLLAFNLCAIISGILAGQMNDRARLAERAQARLNVLLAVSDLLQKAMVVADIPRAMNHDVVARRLGRFTLQDGQGNPIGEAAPPATDGERRAYRLENGGATLGFALFESRPADKRDATVDMDALIALVAMAMERCLLLEQLSEAEAIRRSEELKTALLSSLSHDMRTPLSAISASASSLIALSEDLDAAVRAQLLRTIEEQCERLNRYTANLLDLGRLQHGVASEHLGDVDIVEIMGAVLGTIRGEGSHVIAKQLDCPSAVVRANAVMIEQVFTNLLDNAMRYSPPGSSIAVRMMTLEGVLRVEVIDQGCGIAREELASVFDRFYRSSRTAHQSGQGLGLSIARGFVEAFGGRINIQSPHAGGAGTLVVVELPLKGDGRESIHG